MKLYRIKYLVKEGFKNIWSNRTMSFASAGVLIACLLLTGAAVLFSMNIATAMQELEGNNVVSVYLKQEVPTLKAAQIGQEIQKLDNVETCEFIPKDEAIQQYMDLLGDDGTLFGGLTGEDNFLPDAFRVSMKDLSKYSETEQAIKAIDGVEKVKDYSEIAEKLTALDRMVTTAGFWIVLILSLVSFFIMINTIRVTMFSRRLEISIMKSVGATNWFIRVPFMVEGIAIGLIAGGFSSLILYLVYNQLVHSIQSIALFNPIPIGSVMWKIVLAFLGCGALFGAISGGISIGKYLKKEGGSIVGW